MSHARKPADFMMNKKMPENPRYKNVKAVVDTGSSLRKYLGAIEEMRRNFKVRKDEVFKRIKLQMFVSLMLEVSRLKLNEETKEDNHSDSDNDDIEQRRRNESNSKARPSTPKSTMQSVISGVGELDLTDELHKSPRAGDKLGMVCTCEDQPYLLLDVREADEFAQCHIITAENYASSMLARTMNFETKSLLAFKNKENKIIVLYDEDETRAPKVATTLVQRGYDNIYMLSGGLRLAVEKFPRGLITGILPLNCLPQGAAKSKKSTDLTTKSLKNTFTADDLSDLEKFLGNFSSVSTSYSTVSSVKSVKASVTTNETVTPKLSSRSSKSQTSVLSKSKPWK